MADYSEVTECPCTCECGELTEGGDLCTACENGQHIEDE